MAQCATCGANVRAIDKFCNECGEKNVLSSPYGPTGSPLKYRMSSTTQSIYTKPSLNRTSKDQKKYVYWLGIMFFLLVVGKGHSWHITETFAQGSDENFRGNYTDTRTGQLKHNLLGWEESDTVSRDYPGEENDTTDSSGTYYRIDSEFIDQYDYRTSIQIKEVTSFLMNVAMFLTGISLIFLVAFGNDSQVRSSVSTLSLLAGLVMFMALAYFTLYFTPFEDPEPSNNSDEDLSSVCSDRDSFGIGTFGFEELSGCDLLEYDTYRITSTPGAGFYEMIAYTFMCYLTPIAMPKRRK